MIPNPEVELPNGLAKGSSGRLGVEEWVSVGNAAVQSVVGQNLAARREETALHQNLHVPPILALVSVHKDEVEGFRYREGWERVESGADDYRVPGGVARSFLLRRVVHTLEAFPHPGLEVRVDLQRYHPCPGTALEHGRGAVSRKHPHLQNTPGTLHRHNCLQKHRFQRIRRHLLAVREHGPLRLPFPRPIRRHHFYSHRPHRRTFHIAHFQAVPLRHGTHRVRLC
mmetsp:Transcript_16416/g.20493  ORF Transcript_16416/g.20493 Transcript_16416/m.20493 type:complete len:226 (+) Transcript_16416:470-1147(+)